MQLIAYAGLASRDGLLNDSMYSEVGRRRARVSGRLRPTPSWPAHMALRYLPTSHDVPFWALSGIGGGESVVGGEQPLRGFGAGRFYDRDSFSSSVELRRKVHDLRCHFDQYRCGIHSLHRCRPGIRANQHAALRSTPSSRMGWGFAASRGRSSSDTSISATAARALPRSPGLNYPF